MEPVVKPEPVWLLENHAVNDAGINEEAAFSYIGNSGVKTEIDIEDHSILEESSEYIPILKRSGVTGEQKCVEININTDKPDHAVTRHMDSHSEDKRFKCELCSMSFALHRTLIGHIRTHIRDKRFKCEMCSKCFKQRGHLSNHIRKHTEDKHFKCEVCSKRFTLRKNFTRHISTHI